MKRSYDDSWIDKLAWEELPQLFIASLDFLRAQHDFRRSEFQIPGMVFGHRYLREHVGIEVSLDRKDRCIDSRLVRLSEGRVPQAWPMDSACRVFLFEAARIRRIHIETAITPELSPAATLTRYLTTIADVLRNHFTDVLSDSPQIFAERENSIKPKIRKLP